MVRIKQWAARIAAAVIIITMMGIGAMFAWPGSYNITNPSMTPTISVGTKVFTQKASQYNAGDIITFKAIQVDGQDPLVVTHRLVGFNDDGTLITWGDANDSVDFPAVPVYEADIIGKVVYQIPMVGTVQMWMMAHRLIWVPWVLLVIVLGLVWPFLGPKPEQSDEAEPTSQLQDQAAQSALAP